MRLSDAKLNNLSHLLVAEIGKIPKVAFPRGQNNARLRILALLTDGVRAEDALQEQIRQKIASAKKPVPEGSQEWDILFRKYYEAEMNRIVPPATSR